MNLCQFCNKSFSSKVNLDNHIKTAKYCIKLRGEEAENVPICRYCNSVYSTKRNYDRHIKICKSRIIAEKYESIIEKHKSIIEELTLAINTKEALLLKTKKDYDEIIDEFNKNIDEWESYCDNIEEKLKNTEEQL